MQIKTTSKLLTITALLALLTACGSGNSKDAPVIPDENGNHPAGWAKAHKTAATSNPAKCAECHGKTLTGGISNLGCNTPDPVSGVRCHATVPVTIGQQVKADCKSCHTGGNGQPGGKTAPDRAGAHVKHLALSKVTCATCHNGKGTGQNDHADGKVDFSFDLAYKAKSGGDTRFNHNAESCSAVSCHGGVDTPSWYGTIDVKTECAKCHQLGTAAATPQYNSYYSGYKDGLNSLHQVHLALLDNGEEITCSDCHSHNKLAPTHFANLVTPAFETAAKETIAGADTKTSAYDKTTQTCTTSCHVDRKWNNP
ncbi:MAG: CxxxxCH/CxxCH domain-containing protein [Trichlorobacter sp.]|jgi:predicted CxxxxCH...CXXCH cytochrome family protein|nr:CxxxxCH/CxxCH domain-containing protein [Trichlorobacter sp.]